MFNWQPQQQYMFSKITSNFSGKKSTSITMIEGDKTSTQSFQSNLNYCKQEPVRKLFKLHSIFQWHFVLTLLSPLEKFSTWNLRSFLYGRFI